MKKYSILLVAALLCLSSCTTYSEWSRGATGASVGAMFGSLIGDIIGGPRGGSVGALVGGAAGAAAGVASAKAEQEKREQTYSNGNNYSNSYTYHNESYPYENDVYYGNGNDYSYVAPARPMQHLTVSNIVFADQNNNRCLESGETAYLTFEIHNRSGQPIYNIAPVINCDNKHIRISPTATIARIDAGRGMRYKAVIQAPRNLRTGEANIFIGFAERGNRLDPAKTFRIRTRR